MCNTTPMLVVQMACKRCQTMFEIEEKGAHIHFTTLPKILIGPLAGRWVTFAEVKQAVQAVVAQQAAENKPTDSPASPPAEQQVEQPAENAPPPPEPSPFTEEMVQTALPPAQAEEPLQEMPAADAVQPDYQARAPEIKDVPTRARDLYALGNRPGQIKAILYRDPTLDKAEIDAVVDNLYGEDETRRRRQRTRLWVSIAIGFFVLALCIAAVLLVPTLLSKLTGGTGLVAPLTANQTVAPLLATPVVILENGNGAARPACPQSKDQAAALFGGPADNWFADAQDGSWFLVSRTPVSVHVPGGMNAILVNIAGAGVNTVPGPSSIKNAISVTILCR